MSKSDNNELPIFKNQAFLDLAFTHRSYLNENKKTSPVSNERLEFLGDSILSYVVSQYLYNHYSSWPEGKLTDLRTALVNRETLAKVARKLSLGKYLKLSHGEGRLDDIDHLANRRVRCAGELVQQNAFRIGVLRLERIIKERKELFSSRSD